LPSITATTELVVPKSMPMIFSSAISFSFFHGLFVSAAGYFIGIGLVGVLALRQGK
jgi:hypothetical protein